MNDIQARPNDTTKTDIRFFDSVETGAFVIDKTQHVIRWNRKIAEISGINSDQAVGENLANLFPDCIPKRLKTAIEQALFSGMAAVLTHKLHGKILPLRNRDGQALLHTIYVKPITSPHKVRYCLIEISDATNSEDRENRLRVISIEHKEAENRIRLLTDNLPAVIHQFILTSEGRVENRHVSKGVEQLLGISQQEAETDVNFFQSQITPEHLKNFVDSIRSVAADEGSADLVVQILTPDNSVKWVHVFLRGRASRSMDIIIDGLYLDITTEKINEEELSRLATIDSLTGINNRRQLFNLSEREFLLSRRYHTPLSVLLIDIDHFKTVNDTHGHDAGDTLLKHVAREITASLRKSDIVGRLGGEEFVVTLPHATLASATILAERLRSAIETASPKWGRWNASITVSIGASELMSNDTTFNQTLKRADQAVYIAKKQGRNRVIQDSYA